MKSRLVLCLFLAASLRAQLEFSGFYTTPQTAYYSVTDTPTRTFSGWLKLGQSFSGYKLAAFDAQHEILTLQKGDEVLHLKLRESKVESGRSIITGKVTLGHGESVEGITTTLFLGEETVLPVKDGVKVHLTAERLKDGNLLYTLSFETLRPDGTAEILGAPRVVSRPGEAFAIRIGDLGFSFKPQ